MKINKCGCGGEAFIKSILGYLRVECLMCKNRTIDHYNKVNALRDWNTAHPDTSELIATAQKQVSDHYNEVEIPALQQQIAELTRKNSVLKDVLNSRENDIAELTSKNAVLERALEIFMEYVCNNSFYCLYANDEQMQLSYWKAKAEQEVNNG